MEYAIAPYVTSNHTLICYHSIMWNPTVVTSLYDTTHSCYNTAVTQSYQIIEHTVKWIQTTIIWNCTLVICNCPRIWNHKIKYHGIIIPSYETTQYQSMKLNTRHMLSLKWDCQAYIITLLHVTKHQTYAITSSIETTHSYEITNSNAITHKSKHSTIIYNHTPSICYHRLYSSHIFHSVTWNDVPDK